MNKKEELAILESKLRSDKLTYQHILDREPSGMASAMRKGSIKKWIDYLEIRIKQLKVEVENDALDAQINKLQEDLYAKKAEIQQHQHLLTSLLNPPTPFWKAKSYDKARISDEKRILKGLQKKVSRIRDKIQKLEDKEKKC